ncbi:uncharacterized protein METZ01_LOCUS416176, partial [marine metagenome]
FLTVDEAIAYIKGGNQDIIKTTETLDENNAEATASGDNKQVKRGKTYKEMQEDVVQVSDIVDKVTNPKTWEGTVGGDARGWGKKGAEIYAQKADGGRIGYREGTDDPATELDLLNNWWRTMQANDWKE